MYYLLGAVQADPKTMEDITEFLSLEPRIEEILSMSLPPPYSDKILGIYHK